MILALLAVAMTASATSYTFETACDAQVRYQFQDRFSSAPAEEGDRVAEALCDCMKAGLQAAGADLDEAATMMARIADEKPFDQPEGPDEETVAFLEEQAKVARPCMAQASGAAGAP